MRHCRSFRAKTKQFRVCCICWVIASFELMYWDPSYALIPPEKNMENENLPHLHKKHKQKSSYATSRCRVAHSIVVDFAQPLSKWYCWLSCACMRTTHQYDEWHKNMSSPKSMYWTSGRGFFNSLDCFSCFFSDILHCNGKVSQVLSVGCRACWPTRCRLRTQRASPFMYAIHFSKCNFSFHFVTSICFRGLSSSFQMFLAFDWALLKRLFVWNIFDGFGGWHILQQSEFSSIFDSIRKIEPAGAAEGLRQWVSHRKPKGIVKSA